VKKVHKTARREVGRVFLFVMFCLFVHVCPCWSNVVVYLIHTVLQLPTQALLQFPEDLRFCCRFPLLGDRKMPTAVEAARSYLLLLNACRSPSTDTNLGALL
jgi:hypothetical protein